MRRLVVPEPVLDRGAHRDELDAAARGRRRGGGPRPRAAARGCGRARPWSAAPRRARRGRRPGARGRRRGAAAARPRTSARRWPARAAPSARPRRSSRAIASSSPGAAHCSTCRARSAGGRAPAPELRGGARVRRDAPARARGLVDRPPDERMPEGEPPRHVGRPDEVALEQVVERVERRVGVELRHGPREIGLERLARDRRGVDQPPRVGLERRQLLDERGGDRGRDPAAVRGAGVRRGRPGRRGPAARGRTGCRRCCGTGPRPGPRRPRRPRGASPTRPR